MSDRSSIYFQIMQEFAKNLMCLMPQPTNLKSTDVCTWCKKTVISSAVTAAYVYMKLINDNAHNKDNKDADNSKQLLPMNKQGQRILLLITEPGNEWKFFGSILLKLTQTGAARVLLLCLIQQHTKKYKDNDWDKLWKSCAKLGVDKSNIWFLHLTFYRYNHKRSSVGIKSYQ